MALINCPECRKEVSSAAESCPNCGYGVKKHFDSIQNATKKKKKLQSINKFIDKYGKVFKIVLPICIIVVIAVIIVSILFSPQKIEYLGIYDTYSKQSINVGDDKEKIDSILGTPQKEKLSDTLTFYEYGKHVTITYDDDNKVDTINLSYAAFTSDELDRFIFADNLDYNSTEEDFINKYEYVYNWGDYDDLCVFLKKVRNGYVVINKDTAVKLYNKDMMKPEKHDLYTITFDTLGIDIDETYFYPSDDPEEILTDVK